jgi:type IV pilus assembly protein PilW
MNMANENTIASFSKQRQSGMTLVEVLVALAIGSFLMIGAVQVYNQSRQAFVINESIARVQETAQFAMDTLESDLRMASNWGMHSRGAAVEGRSLLADPNPVGLPAPAACGPDWALDLGRPVEGDNNAYGLPCAATGGAQANSDTITVRRATVATTPLAAGRLQIQSTRVQGVLFADGAIPAGFTVADSETHDLIVNTYYVAANSQLIPGVPTLRRQWAVPLSTRKLPRASRTSSCSWASTSTRTTPSTATSIRATRYSILWMPTSYPASASSPQGSGW